MDYVKFLKEHLANYTNPTKAGVFKVKKDMLVYKKALLLSKKGKRTNKYCIIQLCIPTGALVRVPSMLFVGERYKKLRASEAIVKATAYCYAGGYAVEWGKGQAYSRFSDDFVYTVGKKVTPDFNFDKNAHNECTSGIHFFITEEEAATYYFT